MDHGIKYVSIVRFCEQIRKACLASRLIIGSGPRMERMLQASSTFEVLQHGYIVRCSVGLNEPSHPMQVCRTQARRFLAKKAETIRFVVDHCPLLVALKVAFSLWPRLNGRSLKTPRRPLHFCEFEPITMTLHHAARNGPILEKSRRVNTVIPCKQSTSGFPIDFCLW